jgi:hypothetical protein
MIMALLQNTLATELQRLVPVNTAAQGISNFAIAWENYFRMATVAGIPVTEGSLTTALDALESSMAGLISNVALAIQSGIQSFWAGVASSCALIWPTTPLLILVTPPPLLGMIATSLTPVFANNINSDLSLENSTAAIAAVLHPLQLGGIAVIGPPPPSGTPVPIL